MSCQLALKFPPKTVRETFQKISMDKSEKLFDTFCPFSENFSISRFSFQKKSMKNVMLQKKIFYNFINLKQIFISIRKQRNYGESKTILVLKNLKKNIQLLVSSTSRVEELPLTLSNRRISFISFSNSSDDHIRYFSFH
jgi:hypothetical protein